MKKSPLLSVVIPTVGRPDLLPRAVKSALLAAPNEDVEIIVVPNGPDQSWRRSLNPFSNDPRLRCEAISTAHVSAARNHGLAIARGKYIRFLDDDDFLLPAASLQIEEMERSGAEICSGLVLNVDEDGVKLGTLKFPGAGDFVPASVLASGFILPLGNVYCLEKVAKFRWDESVNRQEDNVWMATLAAGREWNWRQIYDHVGVWYQHANVRVSTVQTSTEHPVKVIDALFKLVNALRTEERLTPSRAEAIASSLLGFCHRHFPSAPLYWHKVAVAACEVAPSAIPDHAVFSHVLLQHINFLALEWAGLPFRLLSRSIRDVKGHLFGWDYRRRL
jgi:hypothetical protein